MSKRTLVFLSLTLVLVSTVWASDTGSISGVVTDPTGAVVPDVTVTARNSSTGIERPVVTNTQGVYAFPNLPVGTYDLTFHKEGFKELRQTGLKVDVTAEVRLDVKLEVGAVLQEVTVAGAAPLVETQRTEMGEVITGSHMTEMPLDGRSYTDLMALQPGVVPTSSGEYGSQTSGNVSVSGQREDANGFFVNGGNVEEGGGNGTSVIPDLDSIAEFRIQTANFDAEYGNYSGGLVNVVTKSGANQFHGNAFEFLRNNKMDARNFFSYNETDPVTRAEIPGSARAELHRNQFGGTIGGPIIHDKLFFFGDYQGTREVRGEPQLVLVPSGPELTGNLADINDQLTGTVSGPYWANLLNTELGYPAGTVTVGEPYYVSGCTDPAQCVFPNAVIPSPALSAPAQALISSGFIPAANAGPYFATSRFKSTTRDDRWSYRTDANTPWGMISGYYFFDDSYFVDPFGGGNLPGFSSVVPSRAQQFNLGDTKSLGPTMVNEVRFNYTRFAFWSGEPKGGIKGPGSLSSFAIGSPSSGGVFAVNPAAEGVPSVCTNEWCLGVFPWSEKQINNTYQLLDNFSKVYGAHTTKFGGEYHVAQINLFDHAGGNGVWGFDGEEIGSYIADFLLGVMPGGGGYLQGQQQVGDVRSGLLSIKTPDAVSAGMVEQIDLSDVVLASEFRGVRSIHLREIVQQLVRVVDLFFGPWEHAQAPLIRANAGNAFRGGIDCKYAPRTGRPDRERTQASRPLDPAFRLARPESEARVVKPYLIDHCGSEGLCVAKIELLSAGGHDGGESGQIAAPERVDEVGVIEEIVARNHAPRRVGIGSVAPSVVAGCGLKF